MRSEWQKLRGKRIAILAGDGFEYVELVVPKKALERAGADTEVVSLHEGKIRGMNITEPTRAVRVDCTLEAADPDRYDALLIPGGFIGPDFIRQSGKARSFVRAFDAAGKPIATLCHGPWLLVSAELVRGRVLASWPGVRDDIVHAGGVWRDEPVVIDGNWVSSRGPADLHVFVPVMIALFTGPAEEQAPSPPEEAAPRPDVSSPQYDRPVPAAVEAATHLHRSSAWTIFGLTLAVGLVVSLTSLVRRRLLG
ncbi:MAG: glutamine amidotransferase [Myxococcales bacterium 68-20]|nr:DJ-1/PfpI/YhbO family deglycase/protease [Myxococcales bacterium]OJY23688.1 MAG: glutamine amidotransferase [Myxococcales bacterium 68-20]